MDASFPSLFPICFTAALELPEKPISRPLDAGVSQIFLLMNKFQRFKIRPNGEAGVIVRTGLPRCQPFLFLSFYGWGARCLTRQSSLSLANVLHQAPRRVVLRMRLVGFEFSLSFARLNGDVAMLPPYLNLRLQCETASSARGGGGLRSAGPMTGAPRSILPGSFARVLWTC